MIGTLASKPKREATNLTITKLAKTMTRPTTPIVMRELALEMRSGCPSEPMKPTAARTRLAKKIRPTIKKVRLMRLRLPEPPLKR